MRPSVICLIGGHDLVRERRELRIDHEDAVGPGQHADHAALSVERVEVVGDLGGLDFNGLEVRLGRCGRRLTRRGLRAQTRRPRQATRASTSDRGGGRPVADGTN